MTQVIINPGTEPLEDSVFENARENINQLILDCGFSLDEIVVTNRQEQYNGRYCFMLSRDGYYDVDIDMPGWPLEKVRYLSAKNQNIWHYPRLYVDGGSFVWKYVVKIAKEQLETLLDEENDIN